MTETEITLEKIKEDIEKIEKEPNLLKAFGTIPVIKYLLNFIDKMFITVEKQTDTNHALLEQNARLKELIPPTSEMTAFQAVISQNHRLKEENTKLKKVVELYKKAAPDYQNITKMLPTESPETNHVLVMIKAMLATHNYKLDEAIKELEGES